MNKLLLTTLLLISSSAFAGNYQSEAKCSRNYSDSPQQPTPFTERDNSRVFGCANGEMSVELFKFFAASGGAAAASAAAAKGAQADALRQCSPEDYAYCYNVYYQQQFSAYQSQFASVPNQ